MLEWIEKQAQESLKARFVTAELIAKEAQTTLTVLLAGVGGSAAYAAKILEPGSTSPVSIAAAIVCVYLVVLSIVLVVGCMTFQSYPALYQDPKNLMHPAYSLDEVREQEVNNVGERITEAKTINDTRASRLNRLRISAALSPVIFAAAAWLTPAAPTPNPGMTVVACKVEPAASSGASTLRCEITK